MERSAVPQGTGCGKKAKTMRRPIHWLNGPAVTSQHEETGVDLMHAGQADRHLLGGIAVGVEHDERVGGGGEEADLAGGRKRALTDEGESLVARHTLVGVDQIDSDEITRSPVEVGNHVGLIAGYAALGNRGPGEEVGATAAGEDVAAVEAAAVVAGAAGEHVVAVVADNGVVELVAGQGNRGSAGRI